MAGFWGRHGAGLLQQLKIVETPHPDKARIAVPPVDGGREAKDEARLDRHEPRRRVIHRMVPYNRLRPSQAPVAKPRHQDTTDGLMRRLLLARHAKSSWGNPALTDHDRPLNARGYRAAQLVGAALSELGCVPDVVLSSTATRTRETWVQMEPHFGGHPRVEFHRALYTCRAARCAGRDRGRPGRGRNCHGPPGHNPSTHALDGQLDRRRPGWRAQALHPAEKAGIAGPTPARADRAALAPALLCPFRSELHPRRRH